METISTSSNRNARGEDASKDLADLVFLADRAKEIRLGRHLPPGVGRLRLEGLEPLLRQPFEEISLDGRQFQPGRQKVDALSRQPAAGFRRFERATEDLGAVHPTCGGERGVVAREDSAKLGALARIGEGARGQGVGRDPGPAQLVEGALERAVEPGAIAERLEVAAGPEELAAGLLHHGQRLRARDQAEALTSEVRADELERQRADRLDAQVDPRVPLARQALDERVSDQQRRPDQDLLLERPPRAGAGELGEEAGASSRGLRARERRRAPRREEKVVPPSSRHSYANARQTVSGPMGVDSARKRGSPLCAGGAQTAESPARTAPETPRT